MTELLSLYLCARSVFKCIAWGKRSCQCIVWLVWGMDSLFMCPPPLPPPPPLPAQAYDLSATTDIIQNINSKCIEYVITIIKLPKIHLNIKYFMQFSFLVISQCHSCVIFFQSNRPMEKLQPCHYSISCRAAPKT